VFVGCGSAVASGSTVASGSAIASGCTIALLHQEKCSHVCAFLPFLQFSLHFHYTFALATVQITMCVPYYIYKLVIFKKRQGCEGVSKTSDIGWSW
jgi:hypothetical protein